MTTPTAQREITADDLLRIADGDHFELIGGQLRERAMGNESSWVTMRLGLFLMAHVDRKGAGWVLGTESGFTCFATPNTVRRPDVAFVRRREGGPSRPPKGYDPQPPDIVAEVLSPNDLASQVEEKVDAWLRAGVGLVWVVSPEARTVRVHRPDGTARLLREGDDLEGEAVLPGFRCSVADLFAEPGAVAPLP